MKKVKTPRVPVLENALEINLPKLMRMAKATGESRVVLDDGIVRTVAMLTKTRLAVFLGDRPWVVNILPVPCLKNRSRPLLKCPRAHEGNFQSLYYHNNELACRHCHELRYRTNLAATAVGRVRIARNKLLLSMSNGPSGFSMKRQPYKWRKRHLRLLVETARLTNVHYQDIGSWLDRQRC